MAKFYLYTTIAAIILTLSWLLTFYKDAKQIETEKKSNGTKGQTVAMLFQFIILVLCPIINLSYAVFLWFYYDKALENYKKEV